MIKYLQVYFLLLVAFTGKTQNVQFKFYTTAEGLSNNRIWSVVQDKSGFLWIYTDALNRFDVQHFQNYNTQPDSIFAKQDKPLIIQALHDEILMVKGHEIIAFNIYTGETNQFPFTKFLSASHSFSTGELVKISDNAVLIPVFIQEANEVQFLQYTKGKISKLTSLKDASVNFDNSTISICSDGKGRLYYQKASKDHIGVLDENGNLIEEIFVSGQDGMTFEKSYLNRVLISRNHQIYILDDKTKKLIPHPVNAILAQMKHSQVSQILETRKGDLWVLGDDRLLLFYQAKSGQVHNYHEQLKKIIPHRQLLSKIMMDQSEVLWISTMNGLLRVVPGRSWFDRYYAGNQSDCEGQCSFRGLTEDESGNIYAGYYSNVLKINPRNKSMSGSILPVSHTPFEMMYQDGNLILNDGKIFDLQQKKFDNPYGLVLHSYDGGIMVPNGNNGIWMAHKNVLYFLDKNKAQPKWKKLWTLPGPEGYTDIKFDESRQKLWLVAPNDLWVYAAQNDSLDLIFEKHWDEKLIIRYMLPDRDSAVWMASESGLIYFNLLNGKFKKYTTEDGLPNNYVTTILPEGDSCLWMGTHHGLSRFNKRTTTFINFYEEDGLTHNEFNRRSVYKAKSGQFFFGGIGGLNAFYPEQLMQKYQEDLSSGKLSLFSFTKTDAREDTTYTMLFNGETPGLDIYYKNKSFQFGFALTDYRNQDKVLYSYQLEGYDNVWSKPSTSGFAAFNSLPGGTYTFKVKSLNSRGQWNPDQLQIKIKVYPPWWKTWWAYALYLLLFFGFGYMVFFFLKKRLELQNNLQLEQAEAHRLKELDTFKSRLFTNLTHEFRTPLTVILGMARQILSSPGPESKNEAKLIENNGINLLRLVNQLLDLSKLEDKSFKLNLQHGDVVSYLRYITQSFQTYANGKNLSLQFFSSEKDLEMDFDPEQLKQVMTNLISNALKFTPSGGDVKVKVQAIDQKHISIQISDTGVGIAEQDLPHIFDRFYQVDGSTTRMGEGTGIGLAHAIELVKLMGGNISVESKLDTGSVFTVTLPIQKQNNTQIYLHHTLPDMAPNEDVPTTIQAAIDKIPHAEPDLSARQPSLLIIEDNPDVVHYLKSCLSSQYELDVALNGRIGIEKALEHIPDLIISDVMMPEKDGLEVCDYLKNDIRTSHIPIILLTAKADLESKISGLKKGADAYLAKPFNKEELLVRLEKLAELRSKLQNRYAYHLNSDPHKKPLESESFSLEDDFVHSIRSILENHYTDENFSLPQLSQYIGMSRSQLFRKMKAVLDVTPSEYIKDFRLLKARDLLTKNDIHVSEAAYQTGFKDPSYFSKLFKEKFGDLPSENK